MRARPHSRSAPAAEEVAGLVARDVEARFAQPAGGELVRGVLLGRVARAMLRDRVDLVEALPDPHAFRLEARDEVTDPDVLGEQRAEPRRIARDIGTAELAPGRVGDRVGTPGRVGDEAHALARLIRA